MRFKMSGGVPMPDLRRHTSVVPLTNFYTTCSSECRRSCVYAYDRTFTDPGQSRHYDLFVLVRHSDGDIEDLCSEDQNGVGVVICE